MKTFITSVFLIILFALPANSQQYLENELKGYNNPNELVTLSANLSFNEAVALISKVSESTTGKRVVSTVELTTPIGIEIENMNYMKALVIIVQYAGLMYEEKEDVIIVKRKNDVTETHTPETYASVDDREVKISAVFFEVNTTEARERGIDWKFLLSQDKLDINGGLTTGASPVESSTGGSGEGGEGTGSSGSGISENTFNLGITGKNFKVGDFFGEASAMFKLFETEGVGEIIASPNIAVREGQKGRIQVGADISVKQRDFAGNVVEKFFSTGSIIDVTPYVYKEDGVNYILLNINAERSSFVPDPQTTIINKTQASTQVVMLDGEETIIGGLFSNDEQITRSGIPILKDLPWWFFGLRYIFGSDKKTITKKELVILLKAELIPTLKERVAGIRSTTPLKDELLKGRREIKFHKFNTITPDK